MNPDLELYQRTMLDTSPNKLKAMSLETLEACHHYLSEAPQTGVISTRDSLQACADRVALLRSEIELKRAEATNSQRHRESVDLAEKSIAIGSETRHWTKIGAWAAIAAAVFAGIALGRDMPLSKLLHAIALKAFPPSSQQMTVPSSVAPTPTSQIQRSQAPPASATATATATPAVTPIKFPPPAP